MINEIFQIEFLKIAFIGAILSSAATSILSVFISLKKISYMGEALSHIAFAGIAIALLIGINPTLINIFFVAFVALLIGLISKKYAIDEANATTIFLSVSMSLGIILFSLNKKYVVDIESYLFGNVLMITKPDLFFLISLLILNSLFIFLFFKEIFYITYNHDISKIYRIPVKPIYFAFLIIMSLNIIISLKIVGVVLIVAQLILPGISALNICRNVKWAILYSILFSEISTIFGFFASYYLNIPSGASIVLVMFIIFLITLIFKLPLSKFLHR